MKVAGMSASITVHPRMRGEHRFNLIEDLGNLGSSPHARGTLLPTTSSKSWKRFIPACAGNTVTGRVYWHRRPVHPRMRGEHLCKQKELAEKTGSSPHARGTPGSRNLKVKPTRFIPACAGNTQAKRASPARIPVHPRMRGEHSSNRRIRSKNNGSSPHARGTPLAEVRDALRIRFIPACAGNTDGFHTA